MPYDNPRNRKLNAAFTPGWEQPDVLPTVIPGIHGDTNVDPFAGSGWGDWLDMAGASEPGGVKLVGGHGLPNSQALPSIQFMRGSNELKDRGWANPESLGALKKLLGEK